MHQYMDYICIIYIQNGHEWHTYTRRVKDGIRAKGSNTKNGCTAKYRHGLSPISNVGTEPRVLSFPQYARFVENAKRLTKNMVKTG